MVSVGLRNEHVFGKKRKKRKKKKKRKMEKRIGGTLVPKPCSGKSKDLRDRDLGVTEVREYTFSLLNSSPMS